MRFTAFFHPLARIATVTMLAAVTLAGCGGTTPARPDAVMQPVLSSSAPPVRIGIALGGGVAPTPWVALFAPENVAASALWISARWHLC